MATQGECQRRFEAALTSFMEACRDIDNETPYSSREPQWWLNMAAMERAARKILEGKPLDG